MKASLFAMLLVILSIGAAQAATDIFKDLNELAPAMDDVFVDIDRKAP